MKKAMLLILFMTLALSSLASATVLNMSGFETGDTQEALTTGGTFSVQTSIKNSGDYSLKVNNATATGTGYVQFGAVLTNGTQSTNIADNNVYSKFQFYYSTKPTDNNEMLFAMITSTSFVSVKNELRLNSNGTLGIYNESGSLIANGSTVLDANKWYEIKYYSGTGTNYPLIVKINDITEFSTTVFDADANQNARISFGKLLNKNSKFVVFYYDDFVASNSGFPSSSSIVRMDIDSNGTLWGQKWVDGNSADYNMVNQVPNDGDLSVLGTTGIYKHALGLESTASAGITKTVNYVRENTYCRESVTATSAFRNMISTMDNDIFLSTSRNLTNAYQNISLISATAPIVDPWTTSILDSTEAGIETTANISTGKLYCTAVSFMVDFTVNYPDMNAITVDNNTPTAGDTVIFNPINPHDADDTTLIFYCALDNNAPNSGNTICTEGLTYWHHGLTDSGGLTGESNNFWLSNYLTTTTFSPSYKTIHATTSDSYVSWHTINSSWVSSDPGTQTFQHWNNASPEMQCSWTTNAGNIGDHNVFCKIYDMIELASPSYSVAVTVSGAGGSTCVYSGSGNWNVNLADNCNLTTNTNIGANKFITYGTGSLTINAFITTAEAHLIGTNIHWLGKGFK